MKQILQSSKYLILIAVFVLLSTYLLALGWSALKAWNVWNVVIESGGKSPEVSLYLIEVVDAVLLAIVLYVFAVSTYELTIGGLKLPDWMIAHNLYELKSKLGSIIALVIAIRFVEYLLEGKLPALEILYIGGASAAIIFALIFFTRSIDK